MSADSGDHAVVVGGTKGLGRAVVDRFLARGLNVTAISRAAPPSGADSIKYVAADLEFITDANDIVAQILDAGGPVRYLAFCQRYRGQGDPWNGELQVSVTATKLLLDGLADHFNIAKDCAVAVASSVYADFVGGTQPDSYHVAKAALNQLVRYHAWVSGRKGIRVNAISPLSYVKPESQEFYLGDPKRRAFYERLVPLKRLGTVDDSANLVDFLCSDKAQFINGQCIYIDGGVSVLWPEGVAQSFSDL